jgi:prepilin-type N-terminal cleavage/methylation domain-containing protein
MKQAPAFGNLPPPTLLRPPKRRSCEERGLRRTSPQSAFTLIEILVALAIMVIVVGCTYGLYIGATKSATRYRARTEVERDARALLRLMGREVRCSYFLTSNEAPTAQSSPAGTSGLPSSPSLAPAPENTPGATITTITPRTDRPVYDYLTGPDGRDGSFLQTLTTGGIADPDHPSSGLYNVAYRLDAEQKMIFRRQVDMLEPPDSTVQQSSWLCVARGVEAIKCSFFDGTTWTDNWKTDLSTGLPYAVKIEIALTDTEGRVSEYSTSVNVPLAAGPLAQSQVAAPAPQAH